MRPPRLVADWHDAADAMTAAGQSLITWSHTVEAAQGKAADAIAKWQQAEKEEASKKAAYNVLSDEQRGNTTLVDT